MTEEEKENVCGKINDEGFGYTFEDYSDFNEIKDKKFHKLRKKYLEAVKELKDYVDWDRYLSDDDF